MKTKRLEVWFSNGEFRAFPKVREFYRHKDENVLEVKFGESDHVATIFLDHVLFMEEFED